MKALTREQCVHISGGDLGRAEASNDGAVGTFGNSSFGSGGFSLGGGSVGGGFEGITPLSCSPAPAVGGNGWFGLSVAETLGVGTGAIGLLGGLGQGYGASLAIEAAGGLGSVGEIGAASAGLLGSAAVGLGSAFVAGYGIGTLAYNNIEIVRDGAQWVVGAVMNGIGGIGGGGSGRHFHDSK